MAISRAQLAKELEPGLNALFGMEYTRYEGQHAEIFDTEASDRAFEEEVKITIYSISLYREPAGQTVPKAPFLGIMAGPFTTICWPQ